MNNAGLNSSQSKCMWMKKKNPHIRGPMPFKPALFVQGSMVSCFWPPWSSSRLHSPFLGIYPLPYRHNLGSPHSRFLYTNVRAEGSRILEDNGSTCQQPIPSPSQEGYSCSHSPWIQMNSFRFSSFLLKFKVSSYLQISTGTYKGASL